MKVDELFEATKKKHKKKAKKKHHAVGTKVKNTLTNMYGRIWGAPVGFYYPVMLTHGLEHWHHDHIGDSDDHHGGGGTPPPPPPAPPPGPAPTPPAAPAPAP